MATTTSGTGVTTRLAQTSKKRLTNIQKTPLPPRGPIFKGTNVTWEDPADTSNVTDYNVYVDTETKLARRIPLGQNTTSGISGARVFISSFNSNSGFESIKVLLPQAIGNLDDAPPPTPLFAIDDTGLNGFLKLSLPAFQQTGTKNLNTLQSGTWTIYCFDESAVAYSTLNGAVLDSDTTFTLTSISGSIVPQMYGYIGQELVFITAVNTGASTITVVRGQKNSLAAGYADMTIFYPLTVQPVSIPIDPSLLGTVAWSNWVYRVPMRDYRVVAIELYVTNSIGRSASTTNLYSGTIDNGIRVLAGLKVQWSTDGILGVQSDVMPPYFLPQTSSFYRVHCEVRTAPVGASLVAVLYKTYLGTKYTIATMTITTGNTVSNYVSGLDVDAIWNSLPMSIDITSVGTTYPG